MHKSVWFIDVAKGVNIWYSGTAIGGKNTEHFHFFFLEICEYLLILFQQNVRSFYKIMRKEATTSIKF